jgi:effector-binding domain-containing protein
MKAMVAKYDIQGGERPAITYVGERKRIKWAEMHQFFGEAYGKAGAAMGQARVKPSGPAAGVYFEWDEVNQEADVLAGFPIADADKGKVQGVTEYTTPAGNAFWVNYVGPYSGFEDVHWALASKLELEGSELNANVVEEYISTPMTEPDSTKLQTNVIWLAKPKAPAN